MEIIRYKKKHKKKKFLNILSKFLGLIHYGYFGIKTHNSNIITIKQMETVRKIFVKITKRTGKLFIRVYFFFPKTSKSLLSRMGKGVGSIKSWISYVKRGTIFLEIVNLEKKKVKFFFRLICSKLKMKLQLMVREIFKKGIA